MIGALAMVFLPYVRLIVVASKSMRITTRRSVGWLTS